MAIEISSKPKIKEPFWLNFTLYSVLVIILGLLVSYFSFVFYEKRTKGEFTTEEIALEKEISNYQKKIEDFNILLNNRKSPLNVFSFLEKNVHPKVWFSDFDLDLERNTLSLSGEVENPEDIEQQIIAFKKEKEIVKEVNLSKFSINKRKKIEFELHLVFDSKIFQ